MPAPEGSYAQVQPITTALSNILRQYPAGGGILRELLQNADDAKAREVTFVLDRASHTKAPVIHNDLLQYQGPSVLAYNDATFTQEDFSSLSRVGSSGKIDDMETTGKFGLGFNSVYNWTDAPSVLSGSKLLLLDPHHGWSREPCPENPGGPVYDFVKHHAEIDVQNQLDGFSAIPSALPFDISKPFLGTIIRVPLRTSKQAKTSLIMQRSIDESEVLDAFSKFGAEVKQGALLFLKNIEQISFYIDNRLLVKARVTNREEARTAKNEISAAFLSVFRDKDRDDFSANFELEQEFIDVDGTKVSKYLVQHTMQTDCDKDVKEWALSQKLYPWVALAVSLKEPLDGRLFVTLPLPIWTHQPAHIHGMFSITADRTNIHSSKDKSLQNLLPGKWNETLFSELVPKAWASLLESRAEAFWKEDGFAHWPTEVVTKTSAWDILLESVVEEVIDQELPVWNTARGCFTHDEIYLVKTDIPANLLVALNNLEMPVTALSGLFYKIMHDKVDRLHPSSVRSYIQNQPVRPGDCMVLLEYVLSDRNYDLSNIPLFPMEDGSFQSIVGSETFLHRDWDEAAMFDGSRFAASNLNLKALSLSVLNQLRADYDLIATCTGLRHRSLQDGLKYFKVVHFEHINDTITENSDQPIITFLEWCRDRLDEDSNLDPKLIANLWLVPILPSSLKRTNPLSTQTLVIFSKSPIYETLSDLVDATARTDAHLHMLDLDVLTRDLNEYLGQQRYAFNLFLIHDFKIFVEWLLPASKYIHDEDLKMRLKDVLYEPFKWWSDINHPPLEEKKRLGEALRRLPVFQKFESESLESLSGTQEYLCIKAKDYPVLPEIPQVTYLCEPNTAWKKLMRELHIVKFPKIDEMFELSFSPYLQTASASDPIRRQVTEFVLKSFDKLSPPIQEKVKALLMVPVTTTWKLIKEAVSPDLSEFYDATEDVHVEMSFFDAHERELKRCGLRTRVTRDVVIERTQYCASSNTPKSRQKIAAVLLRADIADLGDLSQCMDLKWIPVSEAFASPRGCRDQKHSGVVNYVLAITDLEIHGSWTDLFRWNEAIDHSLLKKQIEHCIEQHDLRSIEAVFKYVSTSSIAYFERYATAMSELICVPGESGDFFLPQRVYMRCERLAPYIDKVAQPLAKYLTLLRKIGVRTSPSLKDLLLVSTKLEDTLSEQALEVAIELLTSIQKLKPAPSSLHNLKAPDLDGNLCLLAELTHGDNDLHRFTGVRLLHPRVSRETAWALGIPSLKDRLEREEIGIEDEDQEKYEQVEDPITGIATTLERYPITSTFSEYLANAEDARARKLVWMLDRCEDGPHPSSLLVTEELAEFQGPALFAYNDSIFNDKDFAGFRDVGRGSKRDDAAQIGKFGRGAMTMYHWTDLPMLLSGDFLVLLDPQRKYLTKSSFGPRLAGVKILLSKLRRSRPDQLAPFVGLFAYSLEQDHYDGTIFRFPLRTGESPLKEQHLTMSVDKAHTLLTNYWKQARISLHFLEHAREVKYRIRNQEDPEWTLACQHSLDSYQQFSNSFIQFVTVANQVGDQKTSDNWVVAMQDYPNVPDHIEFLERRKAKDTVCGIAVLTSEMAAKSYFYCSLPLPFETDLPVQLHASFSITGDRQSIPVEDTTSELGADWNRWLLRDCLPDLYLTFLEHLVPIRGNEVFKYWPLNGTKDTRTDLVREGFWTRLRTSHLRLFPVEKVSGKYARRTPQQSTTVTEVVADFLDDVDSSKLRPLLRALDVPLVRFPTLSFEILFQRYHVPVQVLDPAYFRKVLSRAPLKDLEKDKDLQKVILKYATMGLNPKDHHLLNGCKILPLANGKLGTLSEGLVSEHGVYIMAWTSDERSLLEFAAGRVIDASFETDCNPFSSNFNVVAMDPSVLSSLLKEYGVPTVQRSDWVKLMWKYINAGTDESSFDLEELNEFPIYSATRNSTITFLSRADFAKFPAIIKPENDTDVVDKFPGLYVVDPATAPISFNEGRELSSAKGVCRFVRALAILARQGGKSLEDFVHHSLQGANLKALIKLILRGLINIDKSGATLLPQEIINFASLPVWLAMSRSDTLYISPKDAICTTVAAILPSWRAKRKAIHPDWCNKYASILQKLNVPISSAGEIYKVYVRNYFPNVLQQAQVDEYVSLMALLSVSDRRAYGLSSADKIAMDGTLTLRSAESLFDHDNAIFSAAFRYEGSKYFVAPAVQCFKPFWIAQGLKHAGQGYNTKDYLTCLKVMCERAKTADTRYNKDLERVLEHIKWDSRDLERWSYTNWIELSSMVLFPIREFASQPTYRRPRMRWLAKTDLISLSQGAFSADLNLSWSQMPILRYDLAPIVVSRCRALTPHVVVAHLQYLATILEKVPRGELSTYLGELKTIYAYLQENMNTVFATWKDILRTEALWLNIENDWTDPVSMINYWKPSKHLCFRMHYDSEPVMSVNSFLMPFEPLLVAMGCETVVLPPKGKYTKTFTPNPLADSLARMWEDGLLVDVAFDFGGDIIKAHKVVLACASEYFVKQFSEGWTRSDHLQSPIKIGFLTAEAAETVFRHIYRREVDIFTSVVSLDVNEIANKLQSLMDLLEACNYLDIQDLFQDVEEYILDQAGTFIRIDNVTELERIAGSVNAKHLEAYCREMRTRNWRVVATAEGT